MNFKDQLSWVLLSSLLVCSCVSVVQRDHPETNDSPRIEVQELSVQYFDDIERPKTEYGDPTPMKIMPNEPFFKQNLFLRSTNGPSISIDYMECMADFSRGLMPRILNIILPALTLGLYPHSEYYNCPMIISVKKRDAPDRKLEFIIPVQTTASLVQAFRHKDPLMEQLNLERFRSGAVIINANKEKLLDPLPEKPVNQ